MVRGELGGRGRHSLGDSTAASPASLSGAGTTDSSSRADALTATTSGAGTSSPWTSPAPTPRDAFCARFSGANVNTLYTLLYLSAR